MTTNFCITLFHCNLLTVSDVQISADKLVKPIHEKIKQVTADGAYDTNPTYNTLTQQFPSADIVISPQKDARAHKENEFFRNRNILEIEYYGRMGWQKLRNYGRRNNGSLILPVEMR